MHQEENDRNPIWRKTANRPMRPVRTRLDFPGATPFASRGIIDPGNRLFVLPKNGMVHLRDIADDDPVLDHSRLLRAMELTFAYARDHGGIGLTQTKGFNRKFAHWMADHSLWPRFHTAELMRVDKVLNERDRRSGRHSMLSTNENPREVLAWPRNGQASESRSKAVIKGMARTPPCPGTSRISA